MKVRELMFELLKMDYEKEVMIQQGEDFDYMTIHTVREIEVVDPASIDEDEEITAVVIEYI